MINLIQLSTRRVADIAFLLVKTIKEKDKRVGILRRRSGSLLGVRRSGWS